MGRSISRFLSPQTQERNPIATRERASGGGGQLRQRRGGAGRVDISSLSKKTARGKRTPTRKLGRGPARVLAQMGRSISRFLSPTDSGTKPYHDTGAGEWRRRATPAEEAVLGATTAASPQESPAVTLSPDDSSGDAAVFSSVSTPLRRPSSHR
jgi:hypothetical protein